MELNDIYDYFINHGIATEDEIDLVTAINGYNEETLNDILYVKTGYRDMEQYLEYEDEETYQQYYA
jgi:hypothetical protein